MANTFITPDVIARQAYANLVESAVMSSLVFRNYESDFNGRQGDTITVRTPASFTASEFDRTAGIELQEATEGGIPVTLDTLLDVSFAVTSEQIALEVSDFNAQLIAPATDAIVRGIDARVLALRSDVSQSVEYDADVDPALVLVDAGKVLNDAKVPTTGRHIVWSTAGTAAMLKDARFHNAATRGDTDGLREASIGRKFGFDNWMSNAISDNVSVAFHDTAFALVARTLPVPAGASNAAVYGANGFGVRVVQSYDISKKQDVVSIDVLIGVKTLDAGRACLIVPAGS